MMVALWVLGCLLASQAPGVIVGGTNGDGLGNATVSGLQAYLDTRALPVFPFWGNLLRVSDSSGIYLGRNATTGRGWVMTATHVTPLVVNIDSITVAGQAYTVRQSVIIQHTDGRGTSYNTDIRLYAIGGTSGDPELPALPAVPLLATDVANGDNLVLTGRGRRRQSPTEDTVAPYEWDWSSYVGDPDPRQMRWGSNYVEIWPVVAPNLLFLVTEGRPATKKTVCFASVFDQPSPGGTGTAYEGQLALVDSGGGAFVRRGCSWYLAGTNYSAESGSDHGSEWDAAAYGDVSQITHLPTYRGQIEALTGPLVPASSGPLGDLDGDGIDNLLEYALNLDPLSNAQVIMTPVTGLSGLPLIRVENIAGAERLTMEFVRRTSDSGSGLTYLPQFSSNLGIWEAVGQLGNVTTINSLWERVKMLDPVTVTGAAKRFARLQVTEAP